MSRWNETHPWVVERFMFQSWNRVRFHYGWMSVDGKATPKMTLKAAMSCARNWKSLTECAIRVRNVKTDDVIMADIL